MPEDLADGEMTLADLRRRVAGFVAERDWERFHSPQNLTRAIAVEAGELMEPFLWLTAEEAGAAMEDGGQRAAVVDELADVLIYTLSLANALEIDVSGAVLAKLARNEDRFPADAWRGRAWPDDGERNQQRGQRSEGEVGCEH
jgi:NTP pyrophosphatase (non-canonical NTP hydrolase)